MIRRDPPGSLTREIKTQAGILGGTAGLLWAIEIVDVALRGALDRFGIHSLIPDGLWGILFAPFLHGGFAHLAANTLPLLILGWLIMLRETWEFFVVAAIAALVSGLGVWAFSPPGTLTIGASGVIFGFLGFLLLRGYFERSFLSIALSLLVGFLYGSVLWGVLPSQPGISWQAHLFGFLGGVLAARLLARKTP